MAQGLGTLGGSSSIAYAVNDTDEVVGRSTTGQVDASSNPIYHAFSWQNGVMTDLDTLGSPYSIAMAVSGTGRVVGSFIFTYDPTLTSHAFV
jgi:probable HAF family extracellular repeat protein